MVQLLVSGLVLALASGSTAWKVGVSDCGSNSHYINYTTVTGFFLQDDSSTNPSSFDYVSSYLSKFLENC